MSEPQTNQPHEAICKAAPPCPSVLPVQRPFLPPGPYLANLRVLAMSDAKGFQVRCMDVDAFARLV